MNIFNGPSNHWANNFEFILVWHFLCYFYTFTFLWNLMIDLFVIMTHRKFLWNEWMNDWKMEHIGFYYNFNTFDRNSISILLRMDILTSFVIPKIRSIFSNKVDLIIPTKALRLFFVVFLYIIKWILSLSRCLFFGIKRLRQFNLFEYKSSFWHF